MCDLLSSFCLPIVHADDVLVFYRNVPQSLQVNWRHHRTVYTHDVAKFIRSMSQCDMQWSYRIAKIVQYVSGLIRKQTEDSMFTMCDLVYV